MGLFALIAALSFVLCAAPAAPQTQMISTLQIDYIIVREEKDPKGRLVRSIVNQTRFIAPDKRERIEELDSRMARHEATVVDPGRGLVVQLDLRRKTARHNTRAEANRRNLAGLQAESLASPTQKQLDTHIIEGFECRGARSVLPILTIEMSMCKDPVSGLNFMGRLYGETARGGIWRQDIVKVTRGVAVSPQMFEIPADFRVVGQ